MGIRLDHTIVHSRDPEQASAFVAEILGLPAPARSGPFLVVALDNGVSLDFLDGGEGPIATQHYAFRVDAPSFERAFERVRARGLAYWADPTKRRPGETYAHAGDRGFYFDDPSGHLLEVLTGPDGRGAG